MQEHRKGAAVPAVDEFVGDEPLPGRAARAEFCFDRLCEQAFEPGALLRHTRGELRDGRPQRLEVAVRLLQEPIGEIGSPGAAHAAGRAAHEFLVDGLYEFAEPRLRLQPRRRAAGGLERVEPEDSRHDEALPLEFLPPVGTDVWITGGVRLHEEQRPAGREGGHLAGHDPGTVFLCGGHEQQHVAGRHHRLEHVAIAIGVARPRLAGGGRVCPGVRLGIGVGAVDEHDVGHGGRFTAHHAGLQRIERQPRTIDILRDHDHGIDGGRPGHVAGRADGAAGERIDECALAGAGAADHADDEHAGEFTPRPVEPGRNLLPLRPHPPRGRPFGQ